MKKKSQILGNVPRKLMKATANGIAAPLAFKAAKRILTEGMPKASAAGALPVMRFTDLTARQAPVA